MDTPGFANRREFLRMSAAGAIGTAIAAACPAAASAAAQRVAPSAVKAAAMGKSAVQLKEVDEVRVTTLSDNYASILLPTTAVAKRGPAVTPDFFYKPMLRGEHGFAALLEVRKDDGVRRILLDTGPSPTGLVFNADRLGVDLSTLDAIVISHGHSDHMLGTADVLSRLGHQRVRFVAHPYAFLQHGGGNPASPAYVMPELKREILETANIELIETKEPTLLAGDSLVVSGQVARTTSFEPGSPGCLLWKDGKWQPDDLVSDDQSVAVNVRGKGLVVVTGCAHAGIVNTIRHMQAITGVEQIYAVIGGLHLQIPSVVVPSVAAIKEMAPQWVVATHCTGFAGVQEFMRVMPGAFIENAVGTTIVLQ